MRGVPRDNGSRNQSDTAASQGMPIAGTPPEEGFFPPGFRGSVAQPTP